MSYQWRRLHAAQAARAPLPTFTNGWARGTPWVEKQQTRNWPSCTDHHESAHQIHTKQCNCTILTTFPIHCHSAIRHWTGHGPKAGTRRGVTFNTVHTTIAECSIDFGITRAGAITQHRRRSAALASANSALVTPTNTTMSDAQKHCTRQQCHYQRGYHPAVWISPNTVSTPEPDYRDWPRVQL